MTSVWHRGLPLLVMTQAPTGSYDDTPESPVATIIEVPLLWSAEPTQAGPMEAVTAPPRLPHRPRHQRSSAGRHRANGQPAAPDVSRSPAPAGKSRPSRSRTSALDARQEWWHTVRVGAVSAVLVLAIFSLAMGAIAIWLP